MCQEFVKGEVRLRDCSGVYGSRAHEGISGPADRDDFDGYAKVGQVGILSVGDWRGRRCSIPERRTFFVPASPTSCCEYRAGRGDLSTSILGLGRPIRSIMSGFFGGLGRNGGSREKAGSVWRCKAIGEVGQWLGLGGWACGVWVGGSSRGKRSAALCLGGYLCAEFDEGSPKREDIGEADGDGEALVFGHRTEVKLPR